MGDLSPRHREIRLGIKRGTYVNSKSNTAALYDPPSTTLMTFNGPTLYPTGGGPRTLMTFDGPRLLMTGVLRFQHYDTEVLAVDFDKRCLTDHGYADYSVSTRANIDGWVAALVGLRYLPRIPHAWSRWTTNWRNPRPRMRGGRRLNNEAEVDELFETFRAEVPWVERGDFYPRYGAERSYWFYWDRYVDNVAQAFWHSQQTLHQDQNHRYFTYEWGEHPWGKNPTWPLPHHWVRRFIDGDAERRWRNRQRRNGLPCRPIY